MAGLEVFIKGKRMPKLTIYTGGDQVIKALLAYNGSEVALEDNVETDDVDLTIMNANDPGGTAIDTVAGTFSDGESEVTFTLTDAAITLDSTGVGDIKYVYKITWTDASATKVYVDGPAELVVL